MYDLIIIGSGAAGLSAALYAGRYRMKVLVVGREFGGEGSRAGFIENYPGVERIDGYELMEIMRKQVKELGVEVSSDEVTAITREAHCFELTVRHKKLQAHAVIFATGAERRHLGLANEKELTGRGVHYCITCDGPVYQQKTIAIVGGGDASVKGAILATEYADKVYVLIRGKEPIAEPVNMERMRSIGDKIVVINETEVQELVGKERLEKIILRKSDGATSELVLDGLFVEIGAIPNTALATSLGVAMDDKGYIMTDAMMRTNIDGVFAAGDTVNFFGAFKQYVTASATGAVAATSAYNDRKIHGELCELHAQPGM